MSSKLFLILIIILVLLMIHRSSNNMPVSTPAKSTATPVNLPQLDNLLQNVLSNQMFQPQPQVQQQRRF